MKPLFAAILLAVCALSTAPALARERITDFRADIRIEPSGALMVTETIAVVAAGEQIRRGIYRDFPTRYVRPWGRVTVPFEVVSVHRNDRPEPFHTERRERGVRIYFGQPDRLLPAGQHEYVLTYRTDRQVGFFERHDELYWNVTGNDWTFPIEQVQATVRLPQALLPESSPLIAYTGYSGDRGGDFDALINDRGEARFRTTRSLMPGEGFTVVVPWSKGMVGEPSRSESIERWLDDNPEWRFGGIGVVLLLVFYTLAWWRWGRDPAPGVIIPRYEPPPGISAADSRYLTRMGFDDRTFAAGVLSLAVKGWLRIEESGSNFVLTGTGGNGAPLSNDERVLFDALGVRGRGTLAIQPANQAQLKAAMKALEAELKREHLKQHFRTNAPVSFFGLAISAGVLVWAAMSVEPTEPAGLFLMVWLTGWTFGVYALLTGVIRAWREVLRGNWIGLVPALFITAFSIPFVVAEVVVFGLLFSMSPVLLGVLFALVGINYGFYCWLKAPTRLGRPVYDALEGFRRYLDVAEKDRLNLLNPPEETPALFERFLPHALALGVEQRWSERFAATLAAIPDAAPAPDWYRGSHWHPGKLWAFTQGVGSGLATALGAAASPPGSSSGGGGGGSSGGGGGGGGGGGW